MHSLSTPPSPHHKSGRVSSSSSSSRVGGSSNGIGQSPSKRYNGTSSALAGAASLPSLSHAQQQSAYAQNIAKSMTIDEMRQLHQRALRDAEAKQTELRLVLASRYRELVGSSDEVTKMRERSQELHDLVHALPTLMHKLIDASADHASSSSSSWEAAAAVENGHGRTNRHTNGHTNGDNGHAAANKHGTAESQRIFQLRTDLAQLPRLIHRALDDDRVHEATTHLLHFFRLVAAETDEYPLANALAPDVAKPFQDASSSNNIDVVVKAQIRMLFLHLQILPSKIVRMSKEILNTSASYNTDPIYGAQRSAAALSTLDLLNASTRNNLEPDSQAHILDLYFESKADLLQSLLSQLSDVSGIGGTKTKAATTASGANANANARSLSTTASAAEEILSKIVLILQHDVLLHPYQMFILRNFPTMEDDPTVAQSIMNSLPMFLPQVVQTKASNFLAAHLPLIRTKVKTILVEIAGTTAAALGQIRQSLYDKTDGIECMTQLNSNGVCTWEDAVQGIVHIPAVLNAAGSGSMASAINGSKDDGLMGETALQQRKFSLWSVLFSNTFSSLVHSLLTSSFHSVHTKVASTLRQSLANAPPLSKLLPHEAYRNTLHMATDLNAALSKVSDDAHELLVHAEEREESERRLRQSLYVQACEIMGRLICELRHMLYQDATQDAEASKSSVKELIVGRLCYLLKFRLNTLAKLLDPKSSPSSIQGTSGMITLLELQSAFDLADDNDDGLITFDEAIEAVDSAFAGTQYRGAQMVRETLLLSANTDNDTMANASASPPSGGLPNLTSYLKVSSGRDVTLNELALLSARGLRHDDSGKHSALGTIQDSLDGIISTCFGQWAQVALLSLGESLSQNATLFVEAATTTKEDEYKRMYYPNTKANSTASQQPCVGTVSPYLLEYVTGVAFVLNRSISPSDSIVPVPSPDYALSMGITPNGSNKIPTMHDLIRRSLLNESLSCTTEVLESVVHAAVPTRPAQWQLQNDLSFVHVAFCERNTIPLDNAQASQKLPHLIAACRATADTQAVEDIIEQNRTFVFESCDLFLSSLLGTASYDAGTTTSNGSNTLLHTPLPSTCRFALLPVQSDRTLADIQLRENYAERNKANNRQSTVGSGVMRTGLGFLSSMLKKN